jgi:hypothetical protein
MVRSWCWVVSCASVALVSLVGCDQRRTLEEPAAQAKAADGTNKAADGPKQFSFAALTHEIKTGGAQQVTMQVLPGAGLKINPDYPWKATFEPNAALGVNAPMKANRAGFTFEKTAASLPITLVASAPGQHTLSGTVTLSVCEVGGGERCLWFTDEPVALTINAVAGEPVPVQVPDEPSGEPPAQGGAK